MKVDQLLAQEFSCARCGHKGAHVERLAMTGTGWSAWFEFQSSAISRRAAIQSGCGVIPDLEVKRDRALLLQGRDSQLEAAIAYIEREKEE